MKTHIVPVKTYISVLAGLLVLSQVPDWFQKVLYLASGLFILYLAWSAYRNWRDFDAQIVDQVLFVF